VVAGDDLAAGIEAQEGVAAHLLGFFHAFEQKARPLSAQFEVN